MAPDSDEEDEEATAAAQRAQVAKQAQLTDTVRKRREEEERARRQRNAEAAKLVNLAEQARPPAAPAAPAAPGPVSSGGPGLAAALSARVEQASSVASWRALSTLPDLAISAQPRRPPHDPHLAASATVSSPRDPHLARSIPSAAPLPTGGGTTEGTTTHTESVRSAQSTATNHKVEREGARGGHRADPRLAMPTYLASLWTPPSDAPPPAAGSLGARGTEEGEIREGETLYRSASIGSVSDAEQIRADKDAEIVRQKDAEIARLREELAGLRAAATCAIPATAAVAAPTPSVPEVDDAEQLLTNNTPEERLLLSSVALKF